MISKSTTFRPMYQNGFGIIKELATLRYGPTPDIGRYVNVLANDLLFDAETKMFCLPAWTVMQDGIFYVTFNPSASCGSYVLEKDAPRNLFYPEMADLTFSEVVVKKIMKSKEKTICRVYLVD